MSGLYLIGLASIWAGLSYLLWKVWRNAREGFKGGKRTAVDAAGVAVGLLWLTASTYYAGGRALLVDIEVDRLCERDGGVRVYETVSLPTHMFDRAGLVVFYKPSQGEYALGRDYLLVRQIEYLRQGNPEMFRLHTRVYRAVNKKLLGESVFYKRGGGMLPGPWHGTSYICPIPSVENDIVRNIFVKE